MENLNNPTAEPNQTAWDTMDQTPAPAIEEITTENASIFEENPTTSDLAEREQNFEYNVTAEDYDKFAHDEFNHLFTALKNEVNSDAESQTQLADEIAININLLSMSHDLQETHPQAVFSAIKNSYLEAAAAAEKNDNEHEKASCTRQANAVDLVEEKCLNYLTERYATIANQSTEATTETVETTANDTTEAPIAAETPAEPAPETSANELSGDVIS